MLTPLIQEHFGRTILKFRAYRFGILLILLLVIACGTPAEETESGAENRPADRVDPPAIQGAWSLVDPASWPDDESFRLRYTARLAAVLGNLDRAFADQSRLMAMGIPGFAWQHESAHHEFALMRQDPRIARLMRPIGSETRPDGTGT